MYCVSWYREGHMCLYFLVQNRSYVLCFVLLRRSDRIGCRGTVVGHMYCVSWYRVGHMYCVSWYREGHMYSDFVVQRRSY